MTETWKPVARPEVAGRYEVSDQGRVRRVGREKPLYVQRGRDGYMWVQLYRGGGSREDRGRDRLPVHRLVCEAFHGPQPSKDHVAHVLNGKKRIATAANVAWMTRAEAHASDVERGIAPNVERARQILAAKVLVLEPGGVRHGAVTEVAAAFGVSRATVSAIFHRRAWPDAKPDRADREAAAACVGVAAGGR